MKKLLTVIIALMMVATSLNAKTLIVYYSFTNNIRTVVNELSTQIEADVLEVLPTEENVDYAANNYAIGSALISAIRNNPNDASSYPAIKTTINNLADYNTVIIATPLWWSNMAAPMQTFLFTYGAQMAGKNIGLIVSSASSGISGVESDAKRLIPEGNFLESNLWIRSSQTSNAASLISSWLNDIHYNDLTSAVASITANNDFEIIVANGMINVNGEFNTLALYNLSGSKVIETTEKRVSIATLTPGIYIVQATNDGRSVTSKINIR
jgi:multimeric flavodoxin WrbA